MVIRDCRMVHQWLDFRDPKGSLLTEACLFCLVNSLLVTNATPENARYRTPNRVMHFWPIGTGLGRKDKRRPWLSAVCQSQFGQRQPDLAPAAIVHKLPAAARQLPAEMPASLFWQDRR